MRGGLLEHALLGMGPGRLGTKKRLLEGLLVLLSVLTCASCIGTLMRGNREERNDKYRHTEKLGSSGVRAQLEPCLLLYNPETQHVYYRQNMGRG